MNRRQPKQGAKRRRSGISSLSQQQLVADPPTKFAAPNVELIWENCVKCRRWAVGEPSSYPCPQHEQAFAGGVIHDITAQADRSGFIHEIRHGAGFCRWK